MTRLPVVTRLSVRTRWVVAAAVLMVLALGICTVQAAAILRFRNPRPDVVAGVGEPVTVDGVSYRLDTFTVAPQLAAKEPGAEPIRAMADAILVQSVLTVRVEDPSRDLTAIYCTRRLVTPDGRSWSDFDDAYKVAGPERVTCSTSDDQPVTVGRPYQVGSVYQIPASVADQVSLRVELGSGAPTLLFRR